MAVPFTNFHKKWCTDKTQYFSSYKFSDWFRHPPEKSVTNIEEYKSIVKIPISLTDVLERLRMNAYRWVHEWDNDMRRIFNNAMVFNESNTEPYKVAEFFLNKYNKICGVIPNSNEERSSIETLRECKKLLKILSREPSHVEGLRWEIKEISDPLEIQSENQSKLKFKTKRMPRDDVNSIMSVLLVEK